MVIFPTLGQWGSLGPLMIYSNATLHVGLTRFVRTKIYFKCISKFLDLERALRFVVM